jgi:DNA-directed RNA polymerase specialized sigma24 family protein
MEQRACERCGARFVVKPSSKKRYCSHACHQATYWSSHPDRERRRQSLAAATAATTKSPPADELLDLHDRQGLTAPEIAARFGVQSQTVRKWLRQHNIPLRKASSHHEPPNKLPLPDREPLRVLYEDETRTTEQIAARFSVSSATVSNWLRRLDIPLRPPGIGLVARGRMLPDADTLYRQIHVERLSYAEIASQHGVDQSAVMRWLDRYDIPRPIPAQVRLADPETLRDMVSLYEAGASLQAIGEIHSVTRSIISAVFDLAGIPKRPDGWDGGKRLTCDDGHRVRSVYELRVDNWLSAHAVVHIYEPALPGNCRYNADFGANGWYIEIWGVTNSPTYEERKRRKLAHYAAHDLPLIQLPVHAFSAERHDLWARALSQCLNPPPPRLL